MFNHDIAVRYSECDQQGVLFNAHYLAYCDHSMDEYMRRALGDESPVEFMVKGAQLLWHSPLRYRQIANIGCEVTRWGRSSMDVRFAVSSNGEPRLSATLTYVHISTENGEPRSVVIPDDVRAAFLSVS